MLPRFKTKFPITVVDMQLRPLIRGSLLTLFLGLSLCPICVCLGGRFRPRWSQPLTLISHHLNLWLQLGALSAILNQPGAFGVL